MTVVDNSFCSFTLYTQKTYLFSPILFFFFFFFFFFCHLFSLSISASINLCDLLLPFIPFFCQLLFLSLQFAAYTPRIHPGMSGMHGNTNPSRKTSEPLAN